MGIGGLWVSRAWACAPPELAAFDDRCRARALAYLVNDMRKKYGLEPG